MINSENEKHIIGILSFKYQCKLYCLNFVSVFTKRMTEKVQKSHDFQVKKRAMKLYLIICAQNWYAIRNMSPFMQHEFFIEEGHLLTEDINLFAYSECIIITYYDCFETNACFTFSGNFTCNFYPEF